MVDFARPKRAEGDIDADNLADQSTRASAGHTGEAWCNWLWKWNGRTATWLQHAEATLDCVLDSPRSPASIRSSQKIRVIAINSYVQRHLRKRDLFLRVHNLERCQNLRKRLAFQFLLRNLNFPILQNRNPSGHHVRVMREIAYRNICTSCSTLSVVDNETTLRNLLQVKKNEESSIEAKLPAYAIIRIRTTSLTWMLPGRADLAHLESNNIYIAVQHEFDGDALRMVLVRVDRTSLTPNTGRRPITWHRSFERGRFIGKFCGKR